MKKKYACLLLFGWLWPLLAAEGQVETYRVAILDEASMPVEGIRTPAETFEAAWKPEGAEVVRLDAAHLADPPTFNPGIFDLLVIPTGASFPMGAKGTLLAFLQGGGDLLCTGGYAFDISRGVRRGNNGSPVPSVSNKRKRRRGIPSSR